ncbi:MAG: PAS domain-containing protein [Proteobacteria bacterium]|nr:PAS domain-containing protein [Pseudomonadota bacterium]
MISPFAEATTAPTAPRGPEVFPAWDPLLARLGHGEWLWHPLAERWYLSPTCAALLGFGAHELSLSTQDWLPHVYADDRARVAQLLTLPAPHVEDFWQCDYRMLDPLGTERWLLARGTVTSRDAQGAVLSVRGTCTDMGSVTAANQAERQRDQRLATAMEQAHIAWFERDLDTDIGIGSPSIAAIYGLSNATGPWHLDEIRARIVPEDLASHLREVQLSLANKTTDTQVRILQYRIRRPDGELRHLEVRYRNDYDGGHGRAFGLVFDVTATKALESKFQQAMEHTRMAWFERDLVSDEMHGSRSLWQIYGFDPESHPLRFSDILTHIHPDDAARHPADTLQLQARSRALNGRVEETATEVVFYRVIPPGGDVHWLEVRYRLHLDGLGGGTVSGLVVDVTTTKLAEAAARDIDTRLRIALEAAQMASWTWDLDKDVIHSTDAFGDMLDLETPSPWPVPDVLQVIHADDVANVRAEIARVRDCAKTQDLRMEYRVRTPHGEERWIEARGRTNGHSLYGIVIDVTARKLAELERDRLHQQLQQAQKMESIGLLTGGIAHDFNNILASILGYSGLALQRFADRVPEKMVDYLKEVQTAGARARDLVAQMLAFSRGESGELVSMKIDLVLEQTIKMLRPTLPATIEIKTAVEGVLPEVMADPVQLQQVVLNLSINARDAMAGSGSIEMSLGRRHITNGHCASCHHAFDGEFVVLGVADDGPGIPETTQARIFEPFFSTKASGRGTGMGLAMVHGIVHRHQGHILVETAPDAGCKFEILLPLEQPQLKSDVGSEPVDIASYEASRPTEVLVVDDERAVASFVGELLELNGYTVTVETDPSHAWELFASAPERFNLLVTDQTMPRLTGAQLAARVMGVRADLPVVLMTGYSATIDERKARELGIRTYLRKPVRGDELLAAVANAIEQ